MVRVNDHTLGTVATYRYDPFGNATRATGDPEITPFRYAGYYLDATGLYKTGERYYDPSLGRFTQQDPLHDPFDPKLWNRYVYVGNDPVNFTDPTGLWPSWDYFKCWGEELNPFDHTSPNGNIFYGGAMIGQAGGAAIAYWGATGGAATYGTAGSIAAVGGGGALLLAGAGLMVKAGVEIHRRCRDRW